MLRAMAKGAVLFGFGRMPGGARLYRELTRNWRGTQATHVDKLRRVWPGYLNVWRTQCGLEMEGLDVWMHEGGWTPFGPLISYLLTGKGGVLTNSSGRVLDRYVARAVDGALTCDVPPELVPEARRQKVDGLRWCDQAAAIAAIGAKTYEDVLPGALPLETASVDLCHSGGALEHYRPEVLGAFLKESFRVLRPGGVASHVFDHRDHLFHADPRLPFTAHLALPEPAYALLCGHPLLYHSRLATSQVASYFEEAGFERIAVRRMSLPSQRYVSDEEIVSGTPGLRRARLARRFRSISEPDLHTAAAHYVYRKPLYG